MSNAPSKCPYCSADIFGDEAACSSCGASFPWIQSEQRLTNLVKEREVSRVRATLTLIQDLNDFAREGKPFPIAALKGLAFSLMLPSAVLIAGSLLGAGALGVQTFLLFQQIDLQKAQNNILERQTALDVFEKTAQFRTLLAATKLTRNCVPSGPAADPTTPDIWQRSNFAAVQQIAKLAETNAQSVVPAVQTLLLDESGAIGAGAYSVLQLLARGGQYKHVERIANFSGATLANVQMQEAEFPISNFRYADLTSASLDRARFAGAFFRGANLAGASLASSSLVDADLSCTSLVGANLSEADLARASLEYADLSNADLTGVRNWHLVDSLHGAVVLGVRNAPPGFLEFAAKQNQERTKGDTKQPPPKQPDCEPRQSCE